MLKRALEILKANDFNLSNCEHGKFNKYHLENNCLVHTLMVVREAEKIAKRERLNDYEIELLFYSALFHDVGKPFVKFEENGRTFFRGHEFLSSLIWLDWSSARPIDRKIQESVAKIVLYHTLAHKNLARHNYSFLSDIEYKILTLLQESDNKGRIGLTNANRPSLKGNPNRTGNLEFGKIVLLIGLPGVGKSTYVEKILSENPNIAVLSRDEIIETWARLNGVTYNEAFQKIDQNYLNSEFQKRIKEIRDEKEIIVDMTNLTKKLRRKTVNDLKGQRKYIVCKIFLTPFSEILLRNSKRKGKTIKYDVILNMIRNFTPPLLDECNEIDFVFPF